MPRTLILLTMLCSVNGCESASFVPPPHRIAVSTPRAKALGIQPSTPRNPRLTGPTSRAQTSTVIASQSATQGYINVKDFGAKGDGQSDDTSAIQAALDQGSVGTIYFPNGKYIITQALKFSQGQKIFGESRNGVDIIQKSPADYAFVYHSQLQSAPYDIDSGIVFQSMAIFSKYGIQLNQSGDFSTIFSLQGHVKGAVFDNLLLYGTYNNSSDPNFLTSVPATQAELSSYGVGIYWSKVFDSKISNCQIQSYGTGIYLDGCDINEIDNCRLNENGRQIYSLGHDTYGSQDKILDSDILENGRPGGIYLDNSPWCTIQNCYFENYSPSATFIATNDDRGTNILSNRFDDTKQASVPVMSLDPAYGDLVSSNRWNPSAPTPPVEIKTDFWTSAFPILATWTGNAPEMPTPDFPAVQVNSLDPLFFDYNNFSNIDGNASISFPFIKSTVTGKYVVNTSSSTLIFDLSTASKPSRRYLVTYIGRKVNGSGYDTVKYLTGGSTATLHSGYIGFTDSTGEQQVEYTVHIPDDLPLGGKCEFELVNSQVEFQSVRMTPVDYELASSSPSSGEYALGDKIYNTAPASGGYIGWVCVRAGKAHLPSTGNSFAGSSSLTGVSNVSTWQVGDTIVSSALPSGDTITAINATSNSLTVAQPASATQTGTSLFDAQFSPYGQVQ